MLLLFLETPAVVATTLCPAHPCPPPRWHLDGVVLTSRLPVLPSHLDLVGTGQYGAIKYPEFKGNVATVYSHPYSQGSTSQNHYGGDPITYMNIGQAMGQAMVELLKSSA